jgi:PAS domain S-box-containing protein
MLELDQRLNYFLASAPDPTLIVDRSGSIIFASAQVEPVFGYKPRELIGAPVEFMMPGQNGSERVIHLFSRLFS